MPISINGSGTLTGISAGGLPDGCVVDADINGMSSSKLSGALPAISGANLTGVSSAAYSYVDQWALNTDISVSSTSYWSGAQLSRSNSYAYTEGTAMTVSGGGTFSFPATGVYRIYARQQFLANNVASRYVGTLIEYSRNGGTNWSALADAVDAMTQISGATYVNGLAEGFLDVTNTTNDVIRFGGYSAATVTIQGSNHGSGIPTTFFRFIKVADI
tara:strand:+ start:18 stop:665 length:648 start_codon:yes stop_codon:yes gene_type:complete